MPEDAGLKWDRKYSSRVNLSGKPAYVLTSNLHLLPEKGDALDLACGIGDNAIVLAEQGLNTFAWDISRVALSHLSDISKSRNLNITSAYRDVVNNPPEPDSFDVIVVSNFLERSIVVDIISSLKSGGIVYYQTFTKEHVKKSGPENPAYKLDVNELLKLFESLTVRYYQEAGRSGYNEENHQGLAMIVAQKCG